MADRAILVIDSDMETQLRIESTLEAEDYLVFIASTEELGMTMARKVSPALIFVNPAIAGGTGLDICRTLHEMEGLGDVPIIILSSFDGEISSRYRAEYGIVDALAKSSGAGELIAKTSRALSLGPLGPELREAGEHEFYDEAGEPEKEEEVKAPETVQEEPW